MSLLDRLSLLALLIPTLLGIVRLCVLSAELEMIICDHDWERLPEWEDRNFYVDFRCKKCGRLKGRTV